MVGTVLIAAAHGATETFAAAIYAATLSGLFGVSALYHRGRWRPAARRVLQRADQVMILLLIAGSATPAFLLAVTGRAGVTGLSVLWALALTAAACRMFWLNAPPRLVGAVYLGLGWIAGLALPAVWMRFGVGSGGAADHRRCAVHRRRAGLLPPPPRPDPGRVWVSRGLPRLRLRGRHLPVPRDRTIHRLIAARHGTARLGWLKVGRRSLRRNRSGPLPITGSLRWPSRYGMRARRGHSRALTTTPLRALPGSSSAARFR